jgi:DNA oxidative demethylase
MKKKRSLDDYFDSIPKKKKIEQMEKVVIDEGDCKVIYMENFLTKEEETEIISQLKAIHFKKEIIKMYGKTINAPREIFSFGDKGITYNYARKTETPTEWTDAMKNLRDKVFQKSKEFGDLVNEPFNFVLVNKYKDGNDYIGLHSDNEKDMISESSIASLSIGTTRVFNFFKIGTKEKISIPLKSGSLLLMLGKTQKIYKHELPKSKIICY